MRTVPDMVKISVEAAEPNTDVNEKIKSNETINAVNFLMILFKRIPPIDSFTYWIILQNSLKINSFINNIKIYLFIIDKSTLNN